MPASADILNNGLFAGYVGQFETVGSGNCGSPCLPVGTITGWTVTQGNVDWIGNYWQASPGSGNSIDMDGFYSAGGISQTVYLGPGQYVLSFYLAGNSYDTPNHSPIKHLNVSAGSVSENFAFDTTGKSNGNMGWVKETVSFNASGLTTIAFKSTDTVDIAWGPAIGSASLLQVSEFGFYSYSAFMGGLAGLVMFVMRKRRA